MQRDQSVDQREYVPGQYLDIALQWPLIRPHKVLYLLLLFHSEQFTYIMVIH